MDARDGFGGFCDHLKRNEFIARRLQRDGLGRRAPNRVGLAEIFRWIILVDVRALLEYLARYGIDAHAIAHRPQADRRRLRRKIHGDKKRRNRQNRS